MSGRRSTPRGGRRTVPGRATVALVGLVLMAVLALCAWRVVSNREEEEPEELLTRAVTVRHDSLAPTYTYDGEIIRWYMC